MYLGAPARAARIWAYKCCCCHAARRTGSFCGRLAFIGKVVAGRLSVDFSGLGPGFWSSGFPLGASGIRSSYPDNKKCGLRQTLIVDGVAGEQKGGGRHSSGTCVQSNKHLEVKVCRMLYGARARLPYRKKNRRKIGNVLTEVEAGHDF